MSHGTAALMGEHVFFLKKKYEIRLPSNAGVRLWMTYG